MRRRNQSGIQRILALNGGISPRQRRRAAVALRPEEREEIPRGIADGRSIRGSAVSLGRAPSTVTREVKRNGGRNVPRSCRLIGGSSF
ncbi:MAG: helix-turn-helix domain-containing protein [Betaproteobacteria bacterium]|nr:MAG: helix-turn-helix domain-containing protein [Betaproteobacteria bacterium]